MVVEAVDGGVRQVINIKSKNAQTSYDFPIELSKGDKLEISEEGGAVVKNAKNEYKLIIAKPWAKDAGNKELKTWYTIVNGNILKQNIDFTGAAFPVIADPIWCGNVASSVNWVYRNIYNNTYNWSLEIKPTTCGRDAAAYNHNAAWSEVYSRTSNYGYIGYNIYYVWNKSNNYSSMQNQYYCHTDWVQLANFFGLYTYRDIYRDTYHLEPWRADKGYWGFANPFDKCN